MKISSSKVVAIFAFAACCFGNFAQAGYEWRYNGHGRHACAEVDSRGDVIAWVGEFDCRRIAPTHYEWRTNLSWTKSCAEVTYRGEFIQWVGDSMCR
jgi:hypothetical protein